MGWWRISSINMSAGNLLLVNCSQTLSSWIKKYSLFCFCKFLCQLYLRICFCLKRAKRWLEFSIKSIFNQYSMRSFQRELVGFNNFWINFIFREFNWASMSKMSKERLSFWEVWFLFIVLEEIVYSLFNFLFDILWNSIYLNNVPKFGWDLVYNHLFTSQRESHSLSNLEVFVKLPLILSQ